MTSRTYWLNLFTIETWNEFLAAGSGVTGFSESRWSTVRNIKPGDYMLCYLTKVSRFVGVLEAVSEPFSDEERIWSKALYPSRVRVKPMVTLTPETAIPITDLRENLSIFQGISNPNAWSGHVRGSPTKWSAIDGKAVMTALVTAQETPVVRPLPTRHSRTARRSSSRGEENSAGIVIDDSVGESSSVTSTDTQHDEIQWMLLKLGSEMGLDVWVARNDRKRSFDGRTFADVPRIKKSLPLQFDAETMQIIEHIDVLWLRNNSIAAAFEIESTTAIYSGLLRLSDLLAMHPNLSIPLYIVAPDDRHDKVLREVARPTFTHRESPLYKVCRLIVFSTLRSQFSRLRDLGPYLKPEVLDRLSIDCTPDNVSIDGGE